MVFTTTTLFKGIACPEGDSCVLTNCIYSHDPQIQSRSSGELQSVTAPADVPRRPIRGENDEQTEPERKRQKVTYGSLEDKPPSRADLIRSQLAAGRLQPANTPNRNTTQVSRASTLSSTLSSSLAKSVSPPPRRAKDNATSAQREGLTTTANTRVDHSADAKEQKPPEKIESLNPRLISNDPVGHQKRSMYIKHIHGEMARLHKQAKETKGLEIAQVLSMTEQALVKLTLDEEEKIAREQSSVYGNVIKQRIAALKKMATDDWVNHVQSKLVKDPPKAPVAKEKPIVTGLPLEQEYLILPQLVADQKPLAAHGYVPTPPTAEATKEAAAAVEASRNYEICDRCSARFQVFPARNEEGLLASNGPCKYHPNRKVFPPKTKGDKASGDKEPYYPCCSELVGTPGCTRNDEHVFKTSSPARLAATLPFINTPENPSPARDRHGKEIGGLTFDCEMGYTAHGLELIRLTAISWPQGDELLDVLVRPLGAVIDLNSRFSGVFPEHFKKAIPYEEWISLPPSASLGTEQDKCLPIVDSPQRARELLCGFITPSTPVIGHAIDNDLNTVRLCHPTIIDTVLLFAHPRGLPMRFGLKMLASRHLHRAIQMDGERGHDSKEDAITTGDLVRVKVGEKWRSLRSSGWKIIDDRLVPPPNPVQGSQAATVEADGSEMVEEDVGGKKRKRDSTTDEMHDGDEV